MKPTFLVLTTVLILAASDALAQPPEQAPDVPPSGPIVAPDVVVLKDGGMLRGTIAEKNAATVVIVTITGEQRTFPMVEVDYAGPEEARPRSTAPTKTPATPPAPPSPPRKPRTRPTYETAQPFVTVHARRARLRLQGIPDDVTFHVHAGSGRGEGHAHSRSGSAVVVTSIDTYTSICTAPCEATLPVGVHRLALSHDKGQPLEPKQTVRIDGDSEVVGTYTSRAGVRTAGAVTSLGSLGLGLYFLFSSLDSESESAYLWGGLGVMVGGGLIGWALSSTPDEATISVTPMSSTALDSARKSDGAKATDMVPSGAAFYGRF